MVNLSKLNHDVKTQFELLPQSTLIQLDEATAKAVLDGKLQQRPQSVATINKYARDILNNDWLENPQPIIITTEGWLLDGWHRVKAAIQTGRDVVFNVTRNWPTHSTFKVVDTGRGRSVNQLMQMQGLKYATRRSGVANTIVQIAGGSPEGRRSLSLHEVERISHMFRPSIELLLEMRSHCSSTGYPTPVVGCLVFLHDKVGEPVREFADDFFTMRFSETHPARSLKRWVDNNTARDIRTSAVRCTMNAVFSYLEKLPMQKVHSSATGLEWARKLQSSRVEQVRAIVGLK